MHPRTSSFFFAKQMRESGEFGFDSDSPYHIFLRDVQLLVLVFVVAAFVHGLARAIYLNFPPLKKKGERKPAGAKKSKPWWSWPTQAPQTLHRRLASAETGDAVLNLTKLNIERFSMSNLVFAVYRCGKLRVPASRPELGLLLARLAAQEKMPPRAAAHVLWSLARIRPQGHDELANVAGDVIRAKLADLQPADVVCAIWASLELWPEDERILGCPINLAGFSTSELVDLLTTLAGSALGCPSQLTQSTVTAVSSQPVVALTLAEREKLVRAISVVEVDAATRSRILVAVAASIALCTDQTVRRMVPVAAALRVEDVGIGMFEAVAQRAMDSQFAGVDGETAVALGTMMARARLDSLKEFYLELAQVATSLSLSAEDRETLRSAFAEVGLDSLLE